MATIINADTSDGLKFTSDTSGEINLQSGGTTIATVDSSGITAASGKVFSGDGSSLTGVGKILQVVQDTKTDTFSSNSTSFVDVTGLSVSITPSSASSKILVLVNLNVSNNETYHAARLMRDATAIAVGDSAGSRIQSTFHGGNIYSYHIASESMTWLDSPATTSAVTYKMQIRVNNGAYYATVNKSYADTDDSYQGRTVSTITVMEVAG